MIPSEKLLRPGFFTAEGERVFADDAAFRGVRHASAIAPLALAVDEPHEVDEAVADRAVDPDEVAEYGRVVVIVGEPSRAVRALPRRWNVAPYVGVTGFVSVDEILALARPWRDGLLRGLPHRVMGGVLVSAKTLRGEATESLRYPDVAMLPLLLGCLDSRGYWPALHFNSRATGEALDEELARVVDMVPSFGGLQLNLRGLSPDAVARLRFRRPDVELIVQVTPADIADPSAYAAWYDHAARFTDVAQHVLFDASGGQGKPADEDTLQAIEDALALANAECGPMPCMGVAGGFDAANGDLFRRLAFGASPRPLSFDAEGRLRVPVAGADPARKHQDRLDPRLALEYLAAATTELRLAARAARDSVRRVWPEHIAHAFAAHLRRGGDGWRHRGARHTTRVVRHGVIGGFPYAAVRNESGLHVAVAADGACEGTYCDIGWCGWDLRIVDFANAADDEAHDIAERVVACVDADPGELPKEDPHASVRALPPPSVEGSGT